MLGPGTLHLDCHHKSAEVVSLKYEYNLFYISHSCSFRLEHDHLDAREEAQSKGFNHLSAHLILGINIPQVLSIRDQIIYWLIIVSTIVALLGLLAATFVMIFFYYKLKFKPQLITKPTGEVELTLLSKQLEHHPLQTSSSSVNELSVGCNHRWSSYRHHEDEILVDTSGDCDNRRKIAGKPATHL